jgi:hypothetical protein
MVELQQEDRAEKTFNIQELKQLKDTGIPLAEKAQRQLMQKHVESLAESDEGSWPPILITKTDMGYVVVDGYHRVEAIRLKKKQEIRAEVRTFDSPAHVLEEAFKLNMTHGLRAGIDSRSNYAWFLHVTYPDMEQIEIARRAGISQPVVSRAIKREEARIKAEEKQQKPEQEAAREDPHKAKIRSECQRLTQDALRLFEDLGQLPEQEQRAAIAESLQNVGDREALFKVATLLEEILKPRKPRPAPRKEAAAAR